jgi:hypothetical protein
MAYVRSKSLGRLNRSQKVVTFFERYHQIAKKKKGPLPSSCLPTRKKQLSSHWTDFHEIDFLTIV